jgi:hypothetical protein
VLAAHEFSLGAKWHPRPGVAVQTLTLSFPQVATTGWNSNLTQLRFSGTGGTLKRLRVLRPGYAWDSAEIVHRPYLALAQQADSLRTMTLTNTNNSTQSTWADRPRVSDPSWAAKPIFYSNAPVSGVSLDSAMGVNLPRGRCGATESGLK